MRDLLVGDPHSVPEELGDLEALLGLVLETARKYGVQRVVFMGDQYNNHNVVDVRCIEFWTRWFRRLQDEGFGVYALRGNHDQVAPRTAYPHAMLAHPNIEVVAEPAVIGGWAAMPHYHDPKEFVAAALQLHLNAPSVRGLLCHQTFKGAAFDNGWKPDDAVDAADVPFDVIVSGHIHRPQAFGKVTYIGAPRWRTRSDTAADRQLVVYEHGMERPGYHVVARVDTGGTCSRICCLTDSPDEPADLSDFDTKKDRVYVDVSGPAKRVRDRELELKALGALTRGFPDRAPRASVSEADGADVAFGKYAAGFKAPNGTATDALAKAAGRRLGIAS